MSKRAQERRTEEELVVAKSRPACLSPEFSVNSQEWQRDDNPISSSGRRVRGVFERSSTGRLVRGIENQLARTKLDYHSMQISDNQYLDKVFTNIRQKLNRSEKEQIFDQKVNVLICGFSSASWTK